MERPQVIENGSATAVLGLEGMAVLAVSERDGEVEYAIETTATNRLVPGVWRADEAPRSPPDLGA
jgi:hypothetical protein